MALFDAYAAARAAIDAILAEVPEQPCYLAESWLTGCLGDLPEARALWDSVPVQAPWETGPDPVLRDAVAPRALRDIVPPRADRDPEEAASQNPGNDPGTALAAFQELCDGAWERLGETERRALGQVYTPPEVVDLILDDVGYAGEEQARLLDPACGTGAFLARAAERIGGAELDARQAAVRILYELVGIEIRPVICGLARLRLGVAVVWLLASAGALRELAELPVPRVVRADALDASLDRRAIRPRGFRWVVGNPPYLEAKRAEEADKARWRERFAGRIEGAFDLYVCFLELALELAAPDGAIGLIIPNKFMVNRYSRGLRRRLLESRPPRTLRDLSHLPVFRNTGVYPIVLHLGLETVKGESGGFCRTVGPDGGATDMPLSAYAATGQAATYFIPADPVLGQLLARLLAPGMPRLGDHLRFRSTVSFHQKGLREQYVSPGVGPGKLPYLGGKSWMRRKEIAPFQVDWDGYGIRYVAEELAAVGNPLPPIGLFTAPKIIFCQHARRIMAYWDRTGRFVTKDVYPIALAPLDCPDPAAWTAAWAALLNTRVLTVLYGVLFRGISIGGGYYHYLPAFLEQIPCPEPPDAALAALARIARAAESGAPDLDALEDLACTLLGLTQAERAAVARAFCAWASNGDPITDRQLAAARPQTFLL